MARMIKVLQRISALLLYFVSSVIIILLNKIILYRYNFQMHYFLIAIQSSLVVAILLGYFLFSQKAVNFKNIKNWYAAATLLTVMIFTNMKAVYHLPITIFTLFKNLSILATALLEMKFFNRRISRNGYLSLFLIIISSYSGNLTEEVSLAGYAWMTANIAATTGYMLHLKKMMVIDGSSKIESVFFTNMLSIPILGVLSVFFDTPNFMLDNGVLWLLIGISSVCALLTALSTAWTLKIMCTTTLSMVGACNKLMLSLAGLVIFHEKKGLVKLVSIFMGLFASCLYTYDSVKRIPTLPVAVEASDT